MPRKAFAPPLKLHLLGPFRLENESGSLRLSTRKVESLLAYLILHPDEHSREKLAALLWGDFTDAQARDSLRTALSSLRKQLGDELLLADRDTVQLHPKFPLSVDVREFEREARAGHLSLYKGELLADFYDDWIFPERERYRDLYLNTLSRLADTAREGGDHVLAIEHTRRLLAADPTNEPAHRQLMSSHLASGNRHAALKQYEECKRVLRAELDTEPAPETTALHLEIKRSAAEQPASARRLTNVPLPLTSFVGRQREMAEIRGILAHHRLVTLTGAGGSGKTRLGIQVAAQLLDDFEDGVWWIELAALADPALLPQAISKVLGVWEVPNQPLTDTLAKYLRAKKLLLLMDNCEHVIDACARLAEALVSACPDLKLLVTSRETLALAGEHVYLVPTLSLPSTLQLPVHEILEHEATRLFVERALAAKFGFALTEQNAVLIGQICQRLDGMPLAIELAAARVKHLSPEEIAARLDDRFEFLTSGSRTALARHQTLRATIDWSYNLLSEIERLMLQRLSVFAGGFTLEAASAVCAGAGIVQSQVLDLLGHLVDKSLIMISTPRRAVEQTRYRLLESIREYACGKLEETGDAQVRDRHLEYFVGLAEKAESNTFGADSLNYSKRLDQELDNIRAAMDWSIQTSQAITTFRLATALNYFWAYFWAAGLNYIGYNRSSIGEWQGMLNKALSLPEGLKRTTGRAKALNAIGFFFWTDITPFDPRRELEEALSIGRELEDKSIIARSLCNLGLSESVQGNYAEARSLLRQGLDILRELGAEYKTDYLWALIFLGDVALNQDDLSEAQILYGQCSSALKEINDRNFQAYVVRRLGILAWHRGEFQEATELCQESLKFNLELGDERGVIACLSAFAGIALARGKAMLAATLFGSVQALLNARNSRLLQTDRLEFDRNVSTLRSYLEPASLDRAWAEGTVMALEEAIECAI